MTEYRALLLRSRDMLMDGLRAIEAQGLPLQAADSCTNFAYVRLPDAHGAQALLADHGIIVRRFGDEHLRITCGTEFENRDLLSSLEMILKNRG